MKREILVPLDGSQLAEAALPHSVALARATSHAITLLRIVPPLFTAQPIFYPPPPSEALIEAWAEEPKIAKKYLEGIAAQLRAKGLEVRTEVSEGDPASLITGYAKDDAHIDMIAMATHGRGGIDRWIFGSVAEKVLQGTPKPLLLVRSLEAARDTEDAKDEEESSNGGWAEQEISYHKILVPLDGSPLAREGLEVAQTIALATNARLTLEVVVPPANNWAPPDGALVPVWAREEQEAEAQRLKSYLERTAERLADEGINVAIEQAWGDPAEEILRSSHAQADLIVMATHGRSGLQKFWLGSVAVKVVRGSSLPVLLVRGKKLEEVFAVDHAAMEQVVTR